MVLMRSFARVDKEGRILIPKNIQRLADLREGKLVEIKVQGPSGAPFVVINKRTTPH